MGEIGQEGVLHGRFEVVGRNGDGGLAWGGGRGMRGGGVEKEVVGVS